MSVLFAILAFLEKEKWQIGHSKNFFPSTWTVSMWFCRNFPVSNCESQKLQFSNFFSSWTFLMWCFRRFFLENDLSQILQSNFKPSWTVSLCLFNSWLVANPAISVLSRFDFQFDNFQYWWSKHLNLLIKISQQNHKRWQNSLIQDNFSASKIKSNLSEN